jgi:hypothetical protein
MAGGVALLQTSGTRSRDAEVVFGRAPDARGSERAREDVTTLSVRCKERRVPVRGRAPGSDQERVDPLQRLAHDVLLNALVQSILPRVAVGIAGIAEAAAGALAMRNASGRGANRSQGQRSDLNVARGPAGSVLVGRHQAARWRTEMKPRAAGEGVSGRSTRGIPCSPRRCCTSSSSGRLVPRGVCCTSCC